MIWIFGMKEPFWKGQLFGTVSISLPMGRCGETENDTEILQSVPVQEPPPWHELKKITNNFKSNGKSYTVDVISGPYHGNNHPRFSIQIYTGLHVLMELLVD
jgi:hypothetical protein